MRTSLWLVFSLFITSCNRPPQKPLLQTGGTSGASSNQTELTCTTTDPGPAPLRRLNRSQYINSVRDLLGDLPSLSSVLTTQTDSSAFGSSPAIVGKTDIESYQLAAETISAAFVADKTSLNKVFNCDTAAVKRDCALEAFKKIAARAFRSSLSAKDVTLYQSFYDLGAKVSHEHGIELMLTMMLQSSRFLYLFEFGTNETLGSKAVRLSPNEIAARLAFAVWDSIPDDKLLAAAANGELASKEGVQKQLTWMMADPKGQKMFARFLSGWSQLDDLSSKAKNEELYPEWKDANLKQAVHDQALAFFQDVIDNQGATLTALLTSKTVLVNDKTAKVYGGTGSGDFKAVAGPEDATSGLLTLPAFLTINATPDESSPILRGKFVRERLFCQNLPSAPGKIPDPPKVSKDVSTRERLKQHEADPTCGSCHRLMDPIGFGFENFDAIGRFRGEDGGKTVDASGEIYNGSDSDNKFNGVVELGGLLAENADVRSCMTKTWFRFLLSRFEQNSDGCILKKVQTSFENAGTNLKSLPAEIIGSEAFLYRQPVK